MHASLAPGLGSSGRPWSSLPEHEAVPQTWIFLTPVHTLGATIWVEPSRRPRSGFRVCGVGF